MSPIFDSTIVLGKMGCKSSDKPQQKQKLKHRKGLWSPEEDQRLRNHVFNHGHGCWSSVPINAAEEMESPNKTQSDSSNSDSMDLPPSPKRLKMKSPSIESSLNTEKPSTDIDRLVPQMFESRKEPNRGSLFPKVMFAEWLSLESFASSGEPVVSKSTFDHNPSFQDSFMHDYLLEGTFGGEYQNSLSDGSSGNFFSSEFIFESQSQGNEFDFSSGEDLCSEFNLSNIRDVMHI
ncbi:hypothetical protein SADUNF_Sadunf12G0110300 [Salix dunnii]|uniref:Uncharacterized protein n=1 Tax=Salix dunnii TaxID=1413687 RepID=A0A835JJH4_9ROSI|nr:hypothetical protein SADUNF_Sadunf12G0110300 [Salix dunnii]